MTIFKLTSIARTENEVSHTNYSTESAILNNKALSLKTWQLYGYTDGVCGNMFCEGSIAEVLEYVKTDEGEWLLKPVSAEPQGIMSAMFANLGGINYIIRKIEVNE